MTLSRFQQLLKKISPKLRIRQRNYGDVAGIFAGLSGKSGYVCRITKGEFHLQGYRLSMQSADEILIGRPKWGNIKKRGRKTVINLLRNWRWVKNHYQRTMLTYGVEYPDSLLRSGAVGMPIN